MKNHPNNLTKMLDEAKIGYGTRNDGAIGGAILIETENSDNKPITCEFKFDNDGNLKEIITYDEALL